MAQFRFKFYNDALAPAGVIVKHPDGWKTAQIILERHEKYHCLVKYFQADFLWIGDAYDLIRQVLNEQGPMAILKCKIEYSEQINLWEELVTFRMDLSKKEGTSKGPYPYKIKIPLTQESEWIKFIARADIPVDVLGLLDMDNNAIGISDKFTLSLPSQTIQQKLSAYTRNQSINIRNVDYLTILDSGIPTYAEVDFESFLVGDIIQIDLSDIIDLDEIKDRFSIPFLQVGAGEQAAYFLTCRFDGNYSFDIRIEASLFLSTGANNSGAPHTYAGQMVELADYFYAANPYFEIYFQINNDTPILFNTASSPIGPANISTYYTFAQALDLKQGDSIRVFAKVIQDLDNINGDLPAHPFDPDGTKLPPLGLGVNHFRDNINHLFFWGSDNSGLYLERYNFTQKILVGDPEDFNSWYLFGSDPTVPFDAGDPPSGLAKPSYINITANTTFDPTTTDTLLIKDAFKNVLSKIVGFEDCLESNLLDSFKGWYSIQKMLHIRGYSMEAKKLFASFTNLWNGFEPIIPMGLEFINGKFKIEGREYFYNPEPVISISNIPNIIDFYDDKLFFKSIEVGYIKGQTQSTTGLDDPQTKRTFRTIIDSAGIDYKQLSEFVAGSAQIEEARRNRVEATKDFDTDEDMAIIALRFNGEYVVEVGADFQVITNLLNADTRINVRISAVRNFLRALPNYNGCLVGLPTKKYFFTKGDGNYDMTSQGNFDDNEGDQIVDEKGDIDGTSTYQSLPDGYKFNMSMSMSLFKQIDAAKNHALNLSRTETDYVPYFINRIAFTPFQGNADFDVRLTIQGGAAIYRRLEDGTIRELEDGTKRLLE